MIGGPGQRPDVGSGPGAPPLGPQTRTAAATHRPADRPVPPDAISGMTYRCEQAARSAAQITPIADSALEECRVQVSRTPLISAIPGRSPWQGSEGCDWPGGPAVAGKMEATVLRTAAVSAMTCEYIPPFRISPGYPAGDRAVRQRLCRDGLVSRQRSCLKLGLRPVPAVSSCVFVHERN